VIDQRHLRHEEPDPTPVEPDEQREPGKPQIPALRAVVELVKRGHRDWLPRLRELLREEPEMWQYIGDLAHQSRRSWIELAGGQNDLLKESAAIYAEERVKEMAGDNPTPLEKLLSERIVAHELRVLYFEASEAQNIDAEATTIGEFRLKKQEIADRQLARAVNLLAKVQSLLPRARHINWPTSTGSSELAIDSPRDATAAASEQRNQAFGVNRINGQTVATIN